MGELNQKCGVDMSCLGRRNERYCGELVVMWKPSGARMHREDLRAAHVVA